MPPRLRLDLAPATLGCFGLILSLTVLLGIIVLGGERALASHVGCGETITTDTTLDSDLVDCPNHGIVIGADGVTLDLNGHVIEGDGARFAQCRPRREACDIGVLNEGHDGVTVKNGSVRAFDTGVLVAESRENRVVGISSSRNRVFGFVVAEAAHTVMRDSTGEDNPVPDGDGIGVFASRHVRILDNSFRRNALGMHVADSSEILIKGNVVSRNRTEGIKLEGSRNQVRGNRCARNSACISVDRGDRNVIAGNRSVRDVGGVLILKGRANLVSRNVVVRARINGIRLAFEEPGLGGTSNVVRRNVVRGSRGDAFVVASRDRRSFLGGNLAIAGGGDGFDVENPSAKLHNNRAIRNADLGIEAVLGVIDGGGNRASGNGNPLQCTNVFCT
jgi:large repetitive protein